MDKIIIPIENSNEVSDGYHTFGELYEHRCLLFIALMKSNPEISWFAHNHDDGTSYTDWFIAGMNLSTGDISYHLPMYLFRLLNDKNIKYYVNAPKFDGTSKDVINRIQDWLE